MKKTVLPLLLLAAAALGPLRAAGVGFSAKPRAVTRDGKVTITFALSAPADVEVAVLDAKGTVVRHLAAGVLGGNNPPPPPLAAGLKQTLAWDMKDDLGKPVTGAFKVRVRAGMKVTFGRFIGEDPYTFGTIDSIACDEEGNLYVLGFGGEANQGQLVLRAFDPAGRYLREIIPFPADLPPGAMKDVATWNEKRRA